MRHIRRLDVLIAATLFGVAVTMPVTAPAVGPEPPKPAQADPPAKPAATKATKKKKPAKKQSELNSNDGYRAAYHLIYTRGDYEGGLAKLRSLRQDDYADIANMLGYASRKLGRYDDAKAWYEAALTANPNHTLTWAYYGAWHAEQGNMLKARDYLQKVRTICGGEACKEFTLLKGVIEGTAIY